MTMTDPTPIADLDVRDLALIIAVDYPAAMKRGVGVLGAGTHPAQRYLEVALQMRGVTAVNAPGMTFGHDRVADIVNTLVSNLGGWRGETAREVKAALRKIGAKR